MMIIRADKKNIEMVIPLFNAYRMFYGQASDQAGARDFLIERLTREQSVIFIAMIGDQAAGFAQLYPTFTSIGMRNTYILNDLYVDPFYRRQGVGEALMKAAFELCEQEHAASISLQTAMNNHAAKSLYKRMGMLSEKVFVNYYRNFI